MWRVVRDLSAALLAAFIVAWLIAVAGGDLALVLEIGIPLCVILFALLTRRERHAGPVAETRSALTSARHNFEEICAHGGKPNTFFLDDERRDTQLEFEDLSGRTPNKALKKLLLEISQTWNEAWARAAPPRIIELALSKVHRVLRTTHFVRGGSYRWMRHGVDRACATRQ